MNTDTDIFRDTYIRYLGYANEVGEAFRPLTTHLVVKASYGVAFAYVFADTYDKSVKEYKQNKNLSRTLLKSADVLIWQTLASIAIPGFTINRITWMTSILTKAVKASPVITKILPTAVGLASIPLIIHPIDKLVDHLMDHTYREFFQLKGK